MTEKYDSPDVEFVEMEEEDIICTSTCSCNNPSGYGDVGLND